MTDIKSYLIMKQEFERFTGYDDGRWIWKQYAHLTFDDPERAKVALDIIEQGLKLLGEKYVIGEVQTP